jgi:hypothetical protein
VIAAMGSAKRRPAGARPRGEAPERPDDVPDAARWNAHEETWGEGWQEDQKRVGPWTFYFAEGGVAGQVTYVAGLRDGLARWFHKNKSGDLREESRYVRGKLHGKRVWQRTRKGKTPGFEWFDKLGEDTWRYEVPHVNGTAQPRWAAHYGRSGMAEQVPAAADGRSVHLGDHMDKLAPRTALMLVEETFLDAAEREVHDGSLARIARGAKTPRGVYVYQGREGDELFRLQFVYDDAPVAAEYALDAAELSRAFTLAADYYLTARPVFDTPRKR